MAYWTYTQIKEKVERDLGLEEETQVTAQEMKGYCNDAIDEVESIIHDLHEDYFLTKAYLALVTAESEIELPDNIYGQKIRKIIYQNGSDIYTIDRLRGSQKFMTAHEISIDNTEQNYCYILLNNSASEGCILNLYPPAKESSTTNVTIWYLRQANRIIADADTCDIPEWVQVVIQYMKHKCYEKEGITPKYIAALRELERLRASMRTSLKDRVVDDDNRVEMDTSFYEEMS